MSVSACLSFCFSDVHDFLGDQVRRIERLDLGELDAQRGETRHDLWRERESGEQHPARVEREEDWKEQEKEGRVGEIEEEKVKEDRCEKRSARKRDGKCRWESDVSSMIKVLIPRTVSQQAVRRQRPTFWRLRKNAMRNKTQLHSNLSEMDCTAKNDDSSTHGNELETRKRAYLCADRP